MSCRFWEAPGPGGGSADERHLEAVGAPAVTAGKQAEPGGHWVLSQMQGKSSSLRQPRKPATRCSPPPARTPCAAGAHCWDNSALLFAFIFSRRFTKWPLLASSSSVLSRAERSSLWSFLFSAFSSSSIFSAFSAADL